MCNYCLIMARPQFTSHERNFLAFEYHKKKGHRNFMPGLIMDFGRKYLNARQPALCHVRRIYKKAMGFLKSQVYTPKPRDFNELKLALERAVARVDVMCRREVLDVSNRAEKCIANHGGAF